MSTNTFPVLFNSQMLGAVPLTVYQVPSSPSGITLQDVQLKLTNVTAATRSVKVHAVPAAGSPNDGNAVALDMSIPPHDYILLPLERLGAQASVVAEADEADSVNIQAIGGKLHTP